MVTRITNGPSESGIISLKNGGENDEIAENHPKTRPFRGEIAQRRG
jgi:hypothetical protein